MVTNRTAGYNWPLTLIAFILTMCLFNDIIQLCSGITRGRVLNGELYARCTWKPLKQIIETRVYQMMFHKQFISCQATPDPSLMSHLQRRSWVEVMVKKVVFVLQLPRLLLPSPFHYKIPNITYMQQCLSVQKKFAHEQRSVSLLWCVREWKGNIVVGL